MAAHRLGAAVPHAVARRRAGAAAAALYLKDHSYGEYVFDWAWADAYQRHGLRYYPKLLVAVPFTPVPGPRLLARDATRRGALLASALHAAGAAGTACRRPTCCSIDEADRARRAAPRAG